MTEYMLERELLYRIRLNVILNGLVKWYRIALGNSSAYDFYFVPFSDVDDTGPKLLVSIIGVGSNLFSPDNYFSADYVAGKLNLGMDDAAVVAKILNYLLHSQEWED